MTEKQLRRQRLVVLVSLYLLFASWGVYTAATSDPSRIGLRPEAGTRVQLLLGLSICLAFAWFCGVDSKLAGKPLLQLANVGIFFGWPIDVPIYLLWAHRIRGLKFLLLHGLLLFLVSVCAAMLAAYLLFGDPFFA